MAYAELTPLQKNSLPAKTTSLLADDGVSVEVDDQSVFYRGGSLLTKGWVLGPDNAVDSYTEEVTVSATDDVTGAGTVTISARAIKADGTNGAAREWPIGTTIKNTYTTSTHDQIRDNFSAHQTIIAAQRIRLATATTFYVATTGTNDATHGTAVGTPWLTLQYAYDYICGNYDLGGQTVTIQLADGTYTDGLTASGPWVGGGSIVIQGNTGNMDSVVIGVNALACIYAKCLLPGDLTLKYLKLTNTGGYGLINASSYIYFNNINFGACTSAHIYTTGGAIYSQSSVYTISGNAPYHWMIAYSALVMINAETITLAGTPAFTDFAYVYGGGTLFSNAATTFSGSASGIQYLIATGGKIITGGMTWPTGLTTGSGGTTTGGGFYV